MGALYDTIGGGYARIRKADPRMAKAILRALGDNDSVVNVGAGAGSYEPLDKRVVAVEPSMTMIAQRPAGSAPVVQASATSLPFKNDSFDAGLAVLSVHHCPDQEQGLRELRRVSRDRVVVMTWDRDSPGFWLTDTFRRFLISIDRYSLRSAISRARSGRRRWRPSRSRTIAPTAFSARTGAASLRSVARMTSGELLKLRKGLCVIGG